MSNSSLVSYTKLSPNHSGKRTNNICYFTPHCVVGQLSVESLGNIFASKSRQASSNYGIGYDGKIALYVDEANRSWCSSSNWNDQRAITIECASDTTEPYTMNNKVWNSLIDLAVDCCKRNGKNKMIWFGDKTKTLNYTPKSNEMVITVHRWFASKSCPGNWLYSRLGQFADEVNKRLSLRYKIHGQTYGWQDWKYNGEMAGTTGQAKRIESIVIEGGANFKYQIHQQTYGDSKVFKNGEEAGVTGQAKRLESIKIDCDKPIQYRIHQQTYGWTNWVSNGTWCGKKGESKRMEAIEIKFA